MKGYFSFILVFVSTALIFTLLSLNISQDFSKPISIERTYGILMNVKETSFEAARQGALNGFSIYDKTHDINMCKHCIDHFCRYGHKHPNFCDEYLCSLCFRENDAREAAEISALNNLVSLKPDFGPDSITITLPEFSAYLKPAPAHNGYAIDYLVFESDEVIFLNSQNSTIPKGVVIECH